MSCSEQMKTTTIPIQVLEKKNKVKCVDVTKLYNQNPRHLTRILVYPKPQIMPEELTPILLPGGHYKLERIKKRNPPKPIENEK